ncbi:MAG: hypothetical protein CMC57_01135 [Flavobacteriaceae bacterium]|nr:hypothetical protein [Flavobacteriaceae bacterium]|tara:strand:- start:557 stop:784 length:228 start_codon:yes stop_codon:yes gene_type:complete
MKNINNSIKKILIVVFFITFYSCVDVKPDIKIDRIIDLHIDGENVDGLEGEWIITTKENGDVITVKIEKKELLEP